MATCFTLHIYCNKMIPHHKSMGMISHNIGYNCACGNPFLSIVFELFISKIQSCHLQTLLQLLNHLLILQLQWNIDLDKTPLEAPAEQTQDQTLEISQLTDKSETKKHVFLTVNDRLSFIHQCVAYQEDHKHGQYRNFWKYMEALFLQK